MRVSQCLGEEIKRRAYPGFQLSLTRYAPNQFIDFHCHTTPYFSMLISGGYNEENEFNSAAVRVGDLIKRPTDYLHCNRFSGNSNTCFNIEFTESGGNDPWIDLMHNKNDFSVLRSARLKAFEIFYSFMNGENPLQIESLLTEVITSDNHADGLSQSKDHVSLWMRKLVDYLHSNSHHNISLHELSGVVNIGPIYMSRAFKSKFGITIGHYQRNLRISNAFSSLLNSAKPLTEIAYETGFCDQSHMIKQFVRTTGVSPLKIRKQVKKFT